MRPITAPPPFNHVNADAILRSADKEPMDFRIFKLLMSLASPFFAALFTLPQPPLSHSEDLVDGIPVIHMAEDKQTLRSLLEFCYPLSIQEIPRFASLQELQLVLKAAVKFEMEGVQRHARKELVAPRFIESQPLRVFAISCRYGWAAEAKEAARYTLRQPRAGYFVPELEYISAAEYYQLQEYHRNCGEVSALRALLQPAILEHDDEWVWIQCRECPGSGGILDDEYPEPRRWWVEWIQNIAHALRDQPWGEVVKKYDIMQKARKTAAYCALCGEKSSRDLEIFSQILAVEIEKDVSVIKLDINFEGWK